MSTFPRISFNGMNVDFDRHLNTLQIANKESTIINKSAVSGVAEIIDLFEDVIVRAGVDRLSADLIDQLEEWYNYAKSGGLFDFIADQSLGMYLAFEGKSLLSNDGVAGTLTRATAAYVEDPDTGLLVSVAANTARFPTGKFGRGVQLQHQRENILIKSAAFDNVAWTASSITVDAETTEVADPIGTNTAEKCTTTGANGTLVQTTASQVLEQSACFSVYLRSVVPGKTAVLTIKDDSGASLKSETVTLTTKWARYSAVYVNSAVSNANNWRVEIKFTDDASVFYIFGAMLEEGTNHLNAYVPTDAAAATHDADLLVYSLTEGKDVDHYQGSICFWVKPVFSHDEDGDTITTRLFMQFLDENDYAVLTIYRNTSGEIDVYATLSDGSTVSAQEEYQFDREEWIHVVVTYDLTQSTNAFVIYVNGESLNAVSDGGGLTNEIAKLVIGCNISTGAPASGVYDDIIIRKDVLTAADVRALYGRGRAAGHRRNQFEDCVLMDPEFSPIVNQGGNVFDFEAEFTVNPT
jgi:hypothetical protein